MSKVGKAKELARLLAGKAKDNKKLIIGGVLILVWWGLLLANAVSASQDHTCQGGHNCNGGGGTNEQEQSSEATASSNADSVSTSSSGVVNNISINSDAAGSGVSTLSGGGGGSSSSTGGSSQSTSGDSVATTGSSTSSSSIHDIEGGNASADGGSSVSGGNSQDITLEGNTYVRKDPANTAAAIFAGHCQSGASGQIAGGGFSVVNSEQFCDYIRMAAIMREAYEWEMRDCRCEGVCTDTVATMEMICLQTEKADEFLGMYYENLADANRLLQSTELTATADRTVGQLLKPIALIAALILL